MTLPEPLYDETQVPAYSLPDPLEGVTTRAEWWNLRRPELLRLFEEQVYGRVPTAPVRFGFALDGADTLALDGLATRKQYTLRFWRSAREQQAALLLYLPNHAPRPAPAFLGLNFDGNHTIHADPGIGMAATPDERGTSAGRWQVERVLRRGFATATLFYGDFDPDFDDGFQNGIHPLFYFGEQTRPAPHEWGAIGAWAWGLSRALDVLEQDLAIDPARVALHGHSRLGKTALWAGALDPRFALVISNNSGAGGAALSRRRFGERVAHLNDRFPHWFCANFRRYDEREADLPLDQHSLLACIAPRPLLVASAAEDHWADPRGERLALEAARPVYEFLGVDPNRAEYTIRPGKHDVTAQDWQTFLDFASRHFSMEG